MATHRTNHRRMITHVPHHRPRRSSTRTDPEIECRDRLGQGLPGRDRTLRRWSRYCREVNLSVCQRAQTTSNGPRPVPANQNLARCHPQCYQRRRALAPGCLLLGGGSAPSADSLTIDNVWTCWQRAMSGEERDGRSSEDAGGPYTEAYERERRRRGRGWVALIAGVVIGSTHVISGSFGSLPNAERQDLAVGHPMAMVLAARRFTTIASHPGQQRVSTAGQRT